MRMESKEFKLIGTVINLVVGFAIIILAYNFSSVAYRICDDMTINGRLMTFFLQTGTAILCLYLYTKYVMKCSLCDIYMKKPILEKFWLLVAILMPVAVAAVYIFFVPGEFGHEVLTQREVAGLLISSILLYGLMSGITEEMIFRGLILRSVDRLLGRKAAVMVSAVLFAAYHFFSIGVESFGEAVLLLISITLPGVALALVTYETGSIWSAVAIHAFYNILSGGSALFHVAPEQYFSAIFTYTIRSDHWLVVGIPGADCIDTALPAMLGFAGVIGIAFWRLFRTKENEKATK